MKSLITIFMLLTANLASAQSTTSCTHPDLNSDAYKLFVALDANNLSQAQAYLAAGVSANAANCNGLPILDAAVAEGNLNFVKLLVGNGADVNSVYAGGYTPLSSAFGFPDVAQFLISQGADASIIAQTSQGPIPLAALYSMFVCDEKGVQLIQLFLSKRSGDRDVFWSGTPILSQIQCGDHGSPSGTSNSFFATSFILDPLLANGGAGQSYAPPPVFQEVLNLLVQSGLGNINAVDANKNGWGDSVLNDRVRPTDEPEALEYIKMLIDAGASVLSTDTAGDNTLMIAAGSADISVVEYFLGLKKFSINARNFQGQTALMMASSRRSPDAITRLIAVGADVNAKDYDGKTALMYAAESSLDVPGNAVALIKHGAKVNAIDNDGETALALAIQNGNTGLESILRNYSAK